MSGLDDLADQYMSEEDVQLHALFVQVAGIMEELRAPGPLLAYIHEMRLDAHKAIGEFTNWDLEDIGVMRRIHARVSAYLTALQWIDRKLRAASLRREVEGVDEEDGPAAPQPRRRARRQRRDDGAGAPDA